MDDETAFMELSALLTGLYDKLLNATDEYKHIGEEYARRLHGTFPERLPELLDAYKTLGSVNPKPSINDNLLAQLRTEPAFIANEFVARQIVNIWYFSQFLDETNELIDGGFYENGAVWPLIKAHPIGFSNQPHGYWTAKP